MINMLFADMFARGCGGLGEGICAVFTQILYALLQLLCTLLGTFVDLLNIAFYIFAGIDYGDGRFNIVQESTGEKKSILDYFVFNETVTKSYLSLAVIALVLVAIFTIYKIVKQDYFDKAGPRSKGPIFRNVAISCISFILVLPIFYLIIHASSLLAVEVLSAMNVDMDTYAGMKVLELAWSDNGQAMHVLNNRMATEAVTGKAGSAWYLEGDLFFTLLADGNLVRYDAEILRKVSFGGSETGEWSGALATYSQDVTIAGVGTIKNYLFYAQFYWYIFFIAIIVALKAMWTLVLAMIQRIFKLLGLFIVAPAPISQYVLDDGAKFKKWLEQSIQEGLRLVTASFSFAIFLMVIGIITDINFFSAFSESMNAASNGRNEALNVNATALAYAGEFTNIPTVTNTGLMSSYQYQSYVDNAAGWDLLWKNVNSDFAGVQASVWQQVKDQGCEIIIVAGTPTCKASFFQSLINAFLQSLLVIAAGGAIKDLDTLLTPLISGAAGSLDSGNTGGAVNAVGKAAVSVGAAVAGGVIGGIAGSVEARKQAEKEGKDKEKQDYENNKPGDDENKDPTGGGTNTPVPSNSVETPQSQEEENNDEVENVTGGDIEQNPQGEGGEEQNDDTVETPKSETEENNDEEPKQEEGGEDGEGQPKISNDILDVDNIKKGIGGVVNGAKGVFNGAVNKVKGINQAISSSKVGRFFRKNLLGKAIMAPGKLGMRLAGGALKYGVPGVLAGVKRGLGAGLKSAGAAVATAIVGKEAVGSFLEAKKGATDKEEKNTARKERISNASFNKAREQRIIDDNRKKQDTYQTAVDDLRSAGNEEVGAIKNLDNANQELNDANLQLDTAVISQLPQGSQEKIAKSQNAINGVYKKYGVSSTQELDDKIAKREEEINSNPNATQEEKDELAKMKLARTKVNAAQTVIDSNLPTSLTKAVSGIGSNGTNHFAVGGVLHNVAGKKHSEITKHIADQQKSTNEQIKTQQAIVDDLSKPEAEREAAKKKVAELTKQQEQLTDAEKLMTGMTKKEQQIFDSEAVMAARGRRVKAQNGVATAETRMQAAQKNVQVAQRNVQTAATAHARSVGLATRLTSTEGFTKVNGNSTSTRGAGIMARVGQVDSNIPLAPTDMTNNEFAKKPVVKEFLRETGIKVGPDGLYDVGAMRQKVNDYYGSGTLTKKQAAQKKILEDSIEAYGKKTTMPESVSYGEYFKTKLDTAQTNFNTTRENLTTATTDLQIAGKKYFGMEGKSVDEIKKQYETIKDTLPKDQRTAMSNVIKKYDQANTNHTQAGATLKAMQIHQNYVQTTQGLIDTRTAAMGQNAKQLQQLHNTSKAYGTIIQQCNAGTTPQLTPQQMAELSKYGIKIDGNSGTNDIKTAAERAKTQVDTQFGRVAEKNNGIKSEIDEFKAALRGIVDDMRKPAPTQTTSAGTPTFTPRFTGDGVASTAGGNTGGTSRFEIPGSNTGSGDNPGFNQQDQERMQSEIIKQNNDLLRKLERENLQNRQILEDIEDNTKPNS